MPSDQFGQIINPLNGYLILGILKSILILLPFIFVLFFVKLILDRTLNGHSPFIRETEKDLRKISLILSEIFQYGIGLQDEADMTI